MFLRWWKKEEPAFKLGREIDSSLIKDVLSAAKKISPSYIIKNRLMISQLVIQLVFVIVALRIFDIAGLDSSRRPSNAELPAAERADIYDRSGEYSIASDLSAVDAYAEPYRIIDARKAAVGLAKIFKNLSEEYFYNKLTDKKPFVYLKRNISPPEQFAVNGLGEAAINFEKSFLRGYFTKNVFSHVVGYTDIDNNGISGIEKVYDEQLKAGQPVYLSIDGVVQDIVRQNLADGMKKFKAKGAMAILSNVHTGEILAMSKLPDFNPNDVSSAKSDDLFPALTRGLYEMGSSFKLFNTAAALDYGIIEDPYKPEYDTSKTIRVGRIPFTEPHPRPNLLNAVEVLQYSSNLGSIQIALKMGVDKQKEFLRKLGFMERVPLALPELETPRPNDWNADVHMATIAFGYGLQISPLHLSVALNALVNGGYYVMPRLLALEENEMPTGFRVMKQSTSDWIRHMMRIVVRNGTARRANVKGFDVGGKTGTVRKVVDGKYNETNQVRTVFASAFPMLEPKYSLVVIMDEPQGLPENAGYNDSSYNAVVVAKNIIEQVVYRLGVEVVSEKDVVEEMEKYKNKSSVVAPPAEEIREI